MKLKLKTVFMTALTLLIVCSLGAQQKVALKVLNYNDLTSANASDGIAKIWDAYTRAHPEVTIEREDLFNDPFHNKTEAYAASGNLPDVMYAWPSGRSTTLYANKLLYDIGKLLKADKAFAQAYRPLALDPKQFAGGYVGILTQGLTSSHAFYVNKAVLADAGLLLPTHAAETSRNEGE